ncbi:MAG: response regulator [Christensenellaceae bacterium]|nr:response regulator [Christensenellaceae bacterium]
MDSRNKRTTLVTVISVIVLALILVGSPLWTESQARDDTESAVRSVSNLYLEELAGRREQVVSDNLQKKIDVIGTALELMTDEDLSDSEHLQAYQARIKRLFDLERFAFVDEDGLVYTSLGTQTDIDQYNFDYNTITGPEISIKNIDSRDKKVIIAVPVQMNFQGKPLKVCFMEIDMDEMLSGLSMDAEKNGTTFSNMYTSGGVALTDTVLGGLAMEDNLLEALEKADFDPGNSYESVIKDFTEGNQGEVSFTYDGIKETLSYAPVTGTDWFLTYLIRESVITDKISSVTDRIIQRSIIQTIVTLGILAWIFFYIFRQSRKNAKLVLEKETAEAENRVKQEEMERQLALQKKLLEQKQQQQEQNKMITALASDYYSVYYVDLDKGEGVCYQAHEDVENGFKEGEKFKYLDSFTAYAKAYIKEEYIDEFLRFIQPENVKSRLKGQRVIAYRYLVHRHDRDTWEEVRFAGVRRPEDRNDHLVHAVGACFVDVDLETRKSMEDQQALQNALKDAEAANRAKTAFLSNMSHEIRTPMNAIIGLDNIALNDESISDQTREHLEKIGTSAQHLLGIINDILDMSRIESGRLTIKNEEFSFSKTLEQVNTIIGGQCRDKGLHYECRTKGHIDDYYIGDDMKLRQVMINILGNAVKFTPEGGNVSFFIEDVARMDNKATLRFTISDTGIGMSKEYLPKLFDAFSLEDSSSTNKYGSTGLGMPITKSIIELMNGDIEVESEKGKGTTFTFVITLTQADHHDASENDIELKPHEMSVLVIDDDRVACEHAEVILRQVGVTCETVTSGREAVDMVKVRHARRDDYSLIIVDWKMPEMDGVETTKQIRAIVGPNTPIIILTAYNWDDVEQEAREAGVDTFAAKPLFAGTVMDQFREAFRSKKAKLVKETVDLKGRRVLLAEDVQVNAEIMMMVLSMREMEVEHAENGKIALEMFSSHEEGYYDAILMDMRMPEMDGLEATAAIRKLDRADSKTIPIIALTANAFDEDVQRSMQAGLDAHLSKPVEPDLLFETLENLIKE